MFDYIKAERCPGCDCKVRCDTKQNQHCTGDWNESREFFCGATLAFSPNFQAQGVVLRKPCPNTKEERARKAKQHIFMDSIRQQVRETDVLDAATKESVLRYIEHY